jgi:hypothetical protein
LVVLRRRRSWGERWLGRVVRRWLRHKRIFMHLGLEENSKNKAFKIQRIKWVNCCVFLVEVERRAEVSLGLSLSLTASSPLVAADG